MYCANYDYHGLYEPYNFTQLPFEPIDLPIINECVICLEYKNNEDLPIQLQTILYVKLCDCNIWIHVSCLDTWYELNKNCPICKKAMYKDYRFYNILRKIVMVNLYILFGVIQCIIHILNLVRIIIIISFWYNVFFIMRFILFLPFTYSDANN